MENTRSVTIGHNYYPNILIISLGDHKQTRIYGMSQRVLVNASFMRISKNALIHDERNFVDEEFFSWRSQNKKLDVEKPERFFSKNKNKILKTLVNFDIAIVVARTRDLNTINYASKLSSLLEKAKVLTFYFFVKNTLINTKNHRKYDKMHEIVNQNNQMIMCLRESAMIESLEQITLANRHHYISQTLARILEGFIAPFIDVKKNPYLFSKMHFLLKDQKLQTNDILPTIGYSNSVNGKVELALIQAISNPIFKGAFVATETLKVDLRGTFITQKDVEKVNHILNHVLGPKNYIITSDQVEYELEKFIQVTIFALGVDYSKIIEDHSQVVKIVQTNLHNIEHSLFENHATRTIILKTPFKKL